MKLLDTSCLVCLFTEINSPDILYKWIERGYNVCIPFEVFSELQSSHQTKNHVDKDINQKKISVLEKIDQSQFNQFKNRHPYLGIGESAVILKAIEMEKSKQRCYAVLDDKKARVVAEKYGINFTGSYGLINALKARGLITQDQCDDAINKMKHSGFRIDLKRVQNGD